MVTKSGDDLTGVPFLPLRAQERKLEVERRPDGSILLRNPQSFDEDGRTIIEMFRGWSETDPERAMIAQRGDGGVWENLTYAEARRQADGIGQALLNRGFKPGDGAMVLSGNSPEFASFLLGVMTIGGMIAPISPSYSLISSDFAKLKTVCKDVKPKVVFVQNLPKFKPALAALGLDGVIIVTVDSEESDGALLFEELAATSPGPELEQAYATVGPDTVAKILFTSGSTGWPKGVINTHRMMSVNMAQQSAMLDLTGDDISRRLSWFPWHHTAGGNGVFNLTIRDGGVHYLDTGKPVPGLYEPTINNLRELPIHSHSDMPAGWAMLADAMEQDSKLRDHFFSRLAFMTYAGSSLPEELRQRIYRLAVAATGKRVAFLAGFGATETAPGVTWLNWIDEEPGNVGIPVPGLLVKLVPLPDERFEIRVKGPNVTPGYLNQPEATAAAFDDEGFYCMGDAVRLINPDKPIKGLRFAGRLTEDFKLLTATFVGTSALRADVVGALMPLVRDVVVTGEDRAFVGILAWPAMDACRALLGEQGSAMTDEAVIRSPEVRQAICTRLDAWNSNNSASSRKVARLLLMDEPPSVDANEITDKGYVNQRVALQLRKDLIEVLYSDDPDDNVMILK